MARFATNPQIHADSLEKTVDVFLKFLSFRGTRNLPPSLLLFLYFFLALYSSIFAQNRSSAFLTPSQNESVQKPATTNKKAQQAFEKSTKFYAEKNFAMAAAWVDEALKNDSVFAEAHFRKAQLYEIFTQPELALQSYRKAIVLRPEAPSFVFAYQKLIDYHLREGQYAQAKRDLERYIPLLKPNSIAQKRAERQLRTCEYGEKAMLNPLIINPEELSDTVNKYLLQYFPSLTADGETLLFTALNESNDEDLFLTTYQNGSWQKPVAISDKINTNENEGTGALSADGRTLVFTACNRRDGYGSCDLYISHKVGNDWEKPKNLGIEINSHFWDSQPTLSPDGQTLYFVSDRKGGIGGRDVWYSTLNSKGQWTPARNIGDVVNTVDDEASPFMHANGHTLFFASEGHEGLGGYDLFYADSTLTGWQKPRNLGYPINNAENQVALVITADGKYGYYSYDTKKPGVQRMSKIYRFLIPNQLKKQFNVVNSLKGVVTDSKTQKPIKAQLELIDLKTNKVVQRLISDAVSGQYLTTLPNGAEWGLYVSAAGYFYKSLSFDYTQQDDARGYRLDISLEPLNLNAYGVLKNIYFETAKADLQEKSRSELDKLIEQLKIQPSLRIEIAGHTDDVGEAKQNQLLSLKRAQSVVDYLVEAGIARERIRAIGFGKDKPIVPNTSEENRQLNRRIEWRIW